ncbi:para-aminobenzoate synthetase / 4-amino-4-deoxychorismate lyase [Rhodocyclaceae bacterium]|nr:para-aminobenzoate synthetase / 4-amino-4-deoxychorismate lyase [Rhodocyclaceae bacterium]
MKAQIDFPQEDGTRLRLCLSRPVAVLTTHRLEEVAAVIAAAEAHARAGRWVAGFVAYEAAPAFDPAFQVLPPRDCLPLAVFAAYAGTGPEAVVGGDFSCGPWRMGTPPARIAAGIGAVRRGIAAGDYYQVNLTTRLQADFAGDAAGLFAALRAAQPDAYCAHLAGDGWQLLSVSPELFFDWQTDGTLTTRPMKGTAPRHADGAADAAAAEQLRASAKEQAENLMIVDLLRNDLARVAVTGSVRVPRLFAVEALPSAWQMTSTVQATTRPGTGLAEVFRALFPCGSVTGAPKVAAMAAIAACEDAPRGAYCGAIGVIRPGGHASFSVGIRSVVVDERHGQAECGIGSGIVFDSTAEQEYAEWLVKRRFLLRATADFQLLETLRLEDGAYWLRERHLERLGASAGHFGFPCDGARVAAALDSLAERLGPGAWRVRLLLDRHGAVATEAHALEALPGPLRFVLAAAPVDSSDEFLAHKTTRRAVYEAHMPPAGCFDTLLWNERGELTEFTRGNLVVEIAGRRVTPPRACGLLPGVLRAELLARGEIHERVVHRDELAQATGIWFINGVRGMLRLEA